MPTAILFDLYGTLIELPNDGRPYRALARSLAPSRRKAVIDTALTTPGMSLKRFAEQLEIDSEEMDTLQADLNTALKGVRVFGDVIPTLQSARERGIKTAIVSNLATPYKQPVGEFGLDQYFDALVYSCDLGYRKPSKEIYHHAIDRLDCSPNETLMIGDSYTSDVAGPTAVGIKGVHLLRKPRASNAKYKITSLQQVIDMTA